MERMDSRTAENRCSADRERRRISIPKRLNIQSRKG